MRKKIGLNADSVQMIEEQEATLRTFSLPAEGFVRPKFVAAVCGVSISTLYLWIKRGDFPTPMKDGRMTMWNVKDIRSFLEKKQKRLRAASAV